MKDEEIDNIFMYHAPKGTQPEAYDVMRANGKMFAVVIQEFCPESREKSIALTKVQEAVMWANAAIAIHGK